MNTKPLVPTVHLNGTDGASLMACYLEARQAVDFAMEALKATAPHGRDYYVQPDKGALSRATAEYMARMAALETVRGELEDLAVAVADQVHAREASKAEARGSP